MYKFTDAKVLSIDEIMEQLDTESKNPTVERLIFMESRKDGVSNLFPCWIEACGIIPDTKELTGLILCIGQYHDGSFELLRIRMKNIIRDYNVKFRFWDQPPTEGLREDHPFVDSEVAQ